MKPTNSNVTLVASLNYVSAAILGLCSFLPVGHLIMGLAMMAGAFPATGSPTTPGGPPTPAPPGAEAAMAVMGGFFAALSGLFMLAGWALAMCTAFSGWYIQRRKHYIFCLVVSGFQSLFMPVGTIAGIFSILLLVNDKCRAQFPGQPPAEPDAPAAPPLPTAADAPPGAAPPPPPQAPARKPMDLRPWIRASVWATYISAAVCLLGLACPGIGFFFGYLGINGELTPPEESVVTGWFMLALSTLGVVVLLVVVALLFMSARWQARGEKTIFNLILAVLMVLVYFVSFFPLAVSPLITAAVMVMQLVQETEADDEPATPQPPAAATAGEPA